MNTPTSITDHNQVKLTVAVAADPQVLRKDDQEKPAFVTVFCLRNQTPYDGARPGTRMPISVKGNNEVAIQLAGLRKGTQFTATGRLGSYTNDEKQEMFYIFALDLTEIIATRKQDNSSEETIPTAADAEPEPTSQT